MFGNKSEKKIVAAVANSLDLFLYNDEYGVEKVNRIINSINTELRLVESKYLLCKSGKHTFIAITGNK